MATIDSVTNLGLISLYLLIAGLGLGASMQNLVLAVQNTVSIGNVGAATSSVTFFRSLGGADRHPGARRHLHPAGHLADQVRAAPRRASTPPAWTPRRPPWTSRQVPAAVADVIHDAYGDGIGLVFGVAAIIAVARSRGGALHEGHRAAQHLGRARAAASRSSPRWPASRTSRARRPSPSWPRSTRPCRPGWGRDEERRVAGRSGRSWTVTVPPAQRSVTAQRPSRRRRGARSRLNRAPTGR